MSSSLKAVSIKERSSKSAVVLLIEDRLTARLLEAPRGGDLADRSRGRLRHAIIKVMELGFSDGDGEWQTTWDEQLGMRP